MKRENRLGKGGEVVYNKEDRIGQGQFGTVYRGFCPASNTVVAVKVLQDMQMPLSSSSMAQSPPHPLPTFSNQDDDGDNEESARGEAGGATEPAAEQRRQQMPSELRILWELRSYNCPNIVKVLSMWAKCKGRRRPQRREETEDASPDAAAAPVDRGPELANDPSTKLNTYVLVTEFCEGGDLQHRLQSMDSTVHPRVARSLLYQLCNALYTLKRQRMVHRDVKPANLLLTSHDLETATLKLADFGMAKAASLAKEDLPSGTRHEDPAADGHHDGAGMRSRCYSSSSLFHSEMGTPMYMSPERIAREPYGYQADIYSAGMVLLEMLRGNCVRVARASQLRTAVPDAVQRERQRYPSDQVPLWLDLVQKMTATDPAQRICVEDVLRHPWFHAKVGPPLPALTFPLPEKGTPGAEAEEPRMARAAVAAEETCSREAALVSTNTPTLGGKEDDEKTSHPGAATIGITVVAGTGGDGGAGAVSTPVRTVTPLSLTSDAVPASLTPQLNDIKTTEDGSSEAQQASSLRRRAPQWALLGVCGDVDFSSNTARVFGASPSGTAVSLPASCGPHIIAHAARQFVDVVYAHFLHEEQDAVRGLTVVSHLVELVQNGYSEFLEAIESIDGDAVAQVPLPGTPFDGIRGPALSVNQDYSELQRVWQGLFARLLRTQQVYMRQLPAEMVKCAASWRRRLLAGLPPEWDGPPSQEDGITDPAANHSPDNPGASFVMSTVASSVDITAREMNSPAKAPLISTPASPSPQWQASMLCMCAEELLFRRALELDQSEALTALLSLSSHPPGTGLWAAAASAAAAAVATDGAAELLEEEEAERAAARRRGGNSHGTKTGAKRGCHSPMNRPHLGICLLRVLLQQAILSAAEVGLEVHQRLWPTGTSPTTATTTAEGTVGAPPDRGTMPPPSGSAQSSELAPPLGQQCESIFVFHVPVHCTLTPGDVRIVETVLAATTRTFS